MIKAVVGEVNDSCFLQFGLEIQGTNNTSGIWSADKALVRGSKVYAKGKFKSLDGSVDITEEGYILYKDFVNNVQIVLTESKLAPRCRIKVNLPSPDKYNVSEFFVEGNLEVKKINVISLKKSVPGKPIMEQLMQGKKVNLLDKVFIEKLDDPIMQVSTYTSSLGEIQQIRNRSSIDI